MAPFFYFLKTIVAKLWLKKKLLVEKIKKSARNKRLTWNFNGGRYWVRTSDPHRVKVMLSR